MWRSVPKFTTSFNGVLYRAVLNAYPVMGYDSYAMMWWWFPCRLQPK